MSFWDNVKKFAQPYSDDNYDDYDEVDADEFEEQPAPSSARTGRRASPFESAVDTSASAASSAAASSFSSPVMNMSTGKQEVVLFHAKAFDDAAKAADELRKRKAVILNMENVDKALTRRVVDFLSGSVYALDGSVKKVAQSTYLFCPHNMDVIGDLESLHTEADAYF